MKHKVSFTNVVSLAAEFLEDFVDLHNEFTSKHQDTEVERFEGALAKLVAYRVLVGIAQKPLAAAREKNDALDPWINELVDYIAESVRSVDANGEAPPTAQA